MYWCSRCIACWLLKVLNGDKLIWLLGLCYKYSCLRVMESCDACCSFLHGFSLKVNLIRNELFTVEGSRCWRVFKIGLCDGFFHHVLFRHGFWQVGHWDMFSDFIAFYVRQGNLFSWEPMCSELGMRIFKFKIVKKTN